MAENKKSIIVYADWIKKFEALTDEEAGKLIKHFFRYVNDKNPKAPDRITQLLFIDIEQSLKRDLKKWEQRAERSRENGKMGGRPTKEDNPEKPKETQQVILEPKKPDSVNVSVNVSVKDNDIKKEEVEFHSPFDLAFNDFLDMRKKNKKAATDQAIKLLKKKLIEISGGDELTQIKILEQSTINGWAGVFPIKEVKSGQKESRLSHAEYLYNLGNHGTN